MVAKSKTKLQITKEYKWQLWNSENTGKGNELSENTYKQIVWLESWMESWTESWTEKSYGGWQNWTKTAMMLQWMLKQNASRMSDKTYKMI